MAPCEGQRALKRPNEILLDAASSEWNLPSAVSALTRSSTHLIVGRMLVDHHVTEVSPIPICFGGCLWIVLDVHRFRGDSTQPNLIHFFESNRGAKDRLPFGTSQIMFSGQSRSLKFVGICFRFPPLPRWSPTP